LLLLGSAAAPVPAEASPHPTLSYWTRCLPNAKVAGLELSPVEVRHLSCAQADQAIRRARVLLTPGGPIFSTRGYTCRSTSILPRFDPSPIELPAVELCTRANRQQLTFVWNYAS
jgi:hypothetical protein